MSSLFIYTGNLMRNHIVTTDSNKEIIDAIEDTLTFGCHSEYSHYKEICNYWLPNKVNPSDRPELDITVKFYSLDPSCCSIHDALDRLNILLNIDRIDSFILSPYTDLPSLDTWKQLELQVLEGRISQLGVTDLCQDTLDDFIKNTCIQPTLHHVHVNDQLPLDLLAFSKGKGIESIYNGDTGMILSSHELSHLLTRHQMEPHHPQWVIKYTISISSRNIVTDKGYIIAAK
ncbi:hypothetical protein BDB01DRAFT_854059 [Pilobolus umbonatus]|nr:hypothetical protein BDB01DRAFT_854059 [Pilobolus umbonatus]